MSEEKKKSALSRDITFGKKKDRKPTKVSMNFVKYDRSTANKKAVIIFVVFLLALSLFIKFGVVDQISRVSAAENEYNTLQSQLDAYDSAMSDYDDVKKEYDEKVGSFMSDSEIASEDRDGIFTMIDEDIAPSVAVKAVSIKNNQVSVTTDSTSLSTVSSIITILQNDSRNTYVTVTTTAASSDSSGDTVIADFEITYGQKVTADDTEETGGTQQ